MADSPRDVEQAITALKKGSCLLKYGRRGKPKFCPFRLSKDGTSLIWYSGKEEKQLTLSHVSKIIPGQRTAIFQRYPRPDKEYQSFSLIYNDRSLDLICKDKDEAEVWFVGLRALISRDCYRKVRLESIGDRTLSNKNASTTQKISPLTLPFCGSEIFQKDSGETQFTQLPVENPPANGYAKLFADVILQSSAAKSTTSDSASKDSLSSGGVDNANGRGSASETFRVSLSSAVSSSSHGSNHEDFDALGDVYIWGKGIGDGFLGGGHCRIGSSCATKMDASLPKALESAVVLDVQNIACGGRHAVVVTKKGEVFSWGEESGGRLGHGADADVSHPKLIDVLGGMNIELVACGEYHTCAVTLSGDLYTWGDGIHSYGLLGHGSEASHWIPKQVTGQLEGLHVSSVSCGPWHTAVVTSAGQLFTFGEGTFGALGHGDHRGINMPRQVEALKGLRTVRAACGVWHTAAVVEISAESSDSGSSSSGKLFTWGDGDKGRLGHCDKVSRLLPACVTSLSEQNFSQVACGHDITVALTNTGRVYTMGSTLYGQLGNPEADGKVPVRVEGELSDCFVEEITCGSYHVAVLTSRTEVYTWGKGANGRLGHGDNDDRNAPTLVEALKDKQVKGVVCGSTFTAVICLHKWVSSVDQSICSGCRLPFGLRRKRHNCYNCGLVFCKACSSRKSVKASLAPNMNKPYRVCDECYTKLKKSTRSGMVQQLLKHQVGIQNQISNEQADKDSLSSKQQGNFSRLSSVDLKGESKQAKSLCKSETNNIRASPNLSETTKWGSFYLSNCPSILHGSSKKMFSASLPVSRIASRSTSPVSSAPSPTWTDHTTHLIVADDSKKTNDNLSQEVVRLKLQVEELTRKSQFLEAEMERTSKQLKEATAVAGDEAAKCKAAKEVIKSLTAKLKEMAEKIPEGDAYINDLAANGAQASHLLSLDSSVDLGGRITSQTAASSSHTINALPNNANRTTEETEFVENAEPGVFFTVSVIPGGEKCLKRVRFSRKRFSEQQAEKWWAENKSRLQEMYSFLADKKSSICPSSMSDRNDGITD
ncbi:Regulator of chromosome condensation 1/beta-lactamase-inhibitor protein II [Dioscorea alata]|uniref:Regulator of chromosome condensation 1/beta-lactamase-inhibitor protein II n=1 Tax=Dioscorea alata TaxID=55571 RepID=A0ACB7W822_DIOAL|nr:Regulator of chromosome condensation 1/beta-lactamase-inhibitor protein II [Dioscorea alata]